MNHNQDNQTVSKRPRWDAIKKLLDYSAHKKLRTKRERHEIDAHQHHKIAYFYAPKWL